MKVLIRGLVFALLSTNLLFAMDGEGSGPVLIQQMSEDLDLSSVLQNSTTNVLPAARRRSTSGGDYGHGFFIGSSDEHEHEDVGVDFGGLKISKESCPPPLVSPQDLRFGSPGKSPRKVACAFAMQRTRSSEILAGGNHSPSQSVRGGEAIALREARAAQLRIRRATEADVPSLMKMYAGFSDDDYEKVLVFPGKWQEFFLRKSVDLGRIFVSYMPAGIEGSTEDEVVAVVKVFVVPTFEEKCNILCDELKVWSYTEAKGYFANEPLAACTTAIDPGFVLDVTRKPTYRDIDRTFACLASDVIVYYGSAFTKEEFRGASVNFKLEQAALRMIGPDILAAARAQESRQGRPHLPRRIIYAYGVVDSNAGTGSARLRSFSQAVRELLPALGKAVEEPVSFNSYAFLAKKPIFELNEDGSFYQPTDPDTGEPMGIPGLGNMIAYHII